MSNEDMFDRNSVESVHERVSEIECTHKHRDGRSAWKVLLGRCVAECAICGEENDLNPLCVKELREPRDAASTYEEVVQALFIEALRAQAAREKREQQRFLDCGDL